MFGNVFILINDCLSQAEDMYDDELPVEEVIEEEIVDHDEMVAVDDEKKE